MNLQIFDAIDARHLTIAASVLLWTVAIAFSLRRPRGSSETVDSTSF